MNGSPYLTREEKDKLEYFQVTSKPISELLKERGVPLKENTIQNIFKSFIDADLFFAFIDLTGIFLSYCTDIRFNYRDREIFIPYFTFEEEQSEVQYSTLEKLQHLKIREAEKTLGNQKKINVYVTYIRHNYQLKTYTLYSKGSWENNVIQLYDKETNSIYTYTIPDVPFIKTPVSLTKLSEYYHQLHSKSKENKRYEGVKGTEVEKRARKKLGLVEYWSKYHSINYTDVRFFKHSEMEEVYQTNGESYEELMYLFESTLFGLFREGVTPLEENYHKQWNKLGVTERLMKICIHEKPLYLKYYYKNEWSDRLGKRTYERFKM